MIDDLLSICTISGEDGRTSVRATGELDETTSDASVDVCREPLDEGRSVVLDLAEITFMGSAGVAAVRLHAHADSLQQTFRVEHPSRIVRRVLELVRLEEVLLDES